MFYTVSVHGHCSWLADLINHPSSLYFLTHPYPPKKPHYPLCFTILSHYNSYVILDIVFLSAQHALTILRFIRPNTYVWARAVSNGSLGTELQSSIINLLTKKNPLL